MVDRQQADIRRVQKRQLMLFVIVAALLVSAIILCMGLFTMFLIALQGMAFTGTVAGLIVYFAKTRRLKEESGTTL